MTSRKAFSGSTEQDTGGVVRWRRTLAAVAVATLGFSGIGLLGLAPAAADEPTTVTCVEPQVLDEAGTACVEPPLEEVTEPIECLEPQVLDEAGTACVDPPLEEVTEPIECVEPQVLDEAGTACVDPPGQSQGFSALKVTEDVVLQAAPGKIEFCHRTASNTNPYNHLETNLNAFFNAGHIGHTGPVWPAVGPDGKWGDIYPPNEHDADGQNWGPGAEEFVTNGCSSTPSENPGIAVDVEDCTYYDDEGWAEFSATNTESKSFYELLLDDVIVDSGFGDEDISFADSLPPGTYTVTVKMYDDDPEEDGKLVAEVSTEFTIGQCPVLDVSAQPEACSAGTNGTAVLHFTGLIEGEHYQWWVDGPGGSSYGSGDFVADAPTRDQNLAGLRSGDYTATIYWEQSVTLNTVVIIEPHSVTDTTTFTVVPCPPVPTVLLANTGLGGIPTSMSIGLLLTILGGVATAVVHMRRGESPLGESASD